jgi:hypothetical protein
MKETLKHTSLIISCNVKLWKIIYVLLSNINDKRILIIRDLANQTRLDTTICFTYYLIFVPPPLPWYLVFGIWNLWMDLEMEAARYISLGGYSLGWKIKISLMWLSLLEFFFLPEETWWLPEEWYTLDKTLVILGNFINRSNGKIIVPQIIYYLPIVISFIS